MRITPTDLSTVLPLVREYLSTLSDVTDGFFDDNLYQSNFSLLSAPEGAVGFCAVLPGERPMLTAFYLRDAYLRDAKESFDGAVEELGALGAYAASCDKGMMALCLERAVGCGAAIDMQAHFFRLGSAKVRPAAFGPECMRRLTAEETGRMNELMRGEWEDTLRTRPDTRYYALEKGGEPLGFGLLCPHRLRMGSVDIGNYVIEAHRRRGVGRSIILHLTEIVKAEGQRPSVGCWYYNENSRRTLLSAGYLPATRLFNIGLIGRQGG
jgi:GNAT superfamily N-acetyltransferase